MFRQQTMLPLDLIAHRLQQHDWTAQEQQELMQCD